MIHFPITSPTLIFFVVLLIILLAPIVMGKLRIPHIIGMVLAGVLIGEHGLNILERDDSFELFGKVGLLYIMFLAGLEMDLESVKRNSRRFFVFGLLTCLIPLGLTYVMATALLDYSPAAAFLLGCIMASNTLIAYPIVARYGLQRHPSVMLSVGSSMISLFLALVMIAGLAGAMAGNPSGEPTGPASGGLWLFWVLFVVKLVVYIAACFVLIPRLTRYFLRRYSDAVMQFIYVLAVMFLSAALSEAIGVEGIVGAFLSGLILNRYIPSVSPLMNRLEFTGNAVFIPYFLIGVGMLINLGTLFDGPAMLYIVALIVFFGTFGKAVAAYLSSLLFRLSKPEGNMMFGLTCAHAAGAIAMIMVGMRLEVSPGHYLVSNDMLNGVVIMILITCIISSMMTEHAAKQIVLSDKPATAHSQEGDSKIMICVKYPEIAPQLLSQALLVRGSQSQGGIVALNVVYDDEKATANRAEGLQLLERLQRQASAAEVPLQTQVRLASNIANGIKHAFRETGCSEIIMGMHVHTDRNAKFWGDFIQSLYNGLNRQIMLSRFVQPLNTLRRIRVAVPSRAEFEPGFRRWLECLCRLAGGLDCRIQFHGRSESLTLIADYIGSHHSSVRADYTPMSHWNELPQLASDIAADHLLVVVTARKGTISYKNALERLPDELQQHFSGKNLMIIFPDQYGQQKEDSMSFTEAQHREESSLYDLMLRWLHRAP